LHFIKNPHLFIGEKRGWRKTGILSEYSILLVATIIFSSPLLINPMNGKEPQGNPERL
jgi:hypothetical protein